MTCLQIYKTALTAFCLISATSGFTSAPPRIHRNNIAASPVIGRQPTSKPLPLLYAAFLEETEVDRLAFHPFDDSHFSFPVSSSDSSSEQQSKEQRGLMTIIGITFLFASNSPVLHAAFTSELAPPVLLVNAAISSVALLGLIFGGGILESTQQKPLEHQQDSDNASATTRQLELQAGLELGLWKFLGTTANIAGLSLTTANHGAFLIQLTTLIVPVVQGLMGVPIAKRTQFSVILALAGVFLFTQDGGCVATASSLMASTTSTGDALCVVAAAFYATYDLRLFQYGKTVAPRQLITGKIATQSFLSMLLLVLCGGQETMDYFAAASSSSFEQLEVILPCILWSGIAVNAVAPFLQVGGQQAVGPTRCQTIYASQPLWAAAMSFAFLGETVGVQGMTGGLAFLAALFLAATAPPSEVATDEDMTQELPVEPPTPTWQELFNQIPDITSSTSKKMPLPKWLVETSF